MSLMRDVGYDQAFTYAYSRREQTYAGLFFKDDVEESVKASRWVSDSNFHSSHLSFSNITHSLSLTLAHLSKYSPEYYLLLPNTIYIHTHIWKYRLHELVDTFQSTALARNTRLEVSKHYTLPCIASFLVFINHSS